MKRNLAEVEWLEQFLESFLDEEHYDERIPPIIKDIEILLKEITTLWFQGLSEIQSQLRQQGEKQNGKQKEPLPIFTTILEGPILFDKGGGPGDNVLSIILAVKG